MIRRMVVSVGSSFDRQLMKCVAKASGTISKSPDEQWTTGGGPVVGGRPSGGSSGGSWAGGVTCCCPASGALPAEEGILAGGWMGMPSSLSSSSERARFLAGAGWGGSNGDPGVVTALVDGTGGAVLWVFAGVASGGGDVVGVLLLLRAGVLPPGGQGGWAGPPRFVPF